MERLTKHIADTKNESVEGWKWAWCGFAEGQKPPATMHIPDEIVSQDTAIILAIGKFGGGGSRKAELSVGYLVGDGGKPNRELSEPEREFLAAILRYAADGIEREHEVSFQGSE